MPKTGVFVEVRGVKETLAKIDLMDARVRQGIKEEVAKSALNIQLGAKQRCPVRTGALRNSIVVNFYGFMSAQVGTSLPYAPFVEFGTRKMAAKPYLFPAFEEERPKFEERLAEVIRRAAK